MSTPNSHRVLSLFSNIGIAEAYLEQIGINVCVANEIDPKRASLYNKIYPKTNMICGDITNKKIYDSIIKSAKDYKINIIISTPPCQGMSTAGKQKKLDNRNNLFFYTIDAINDLEPDYFLIENVPGFLNTKVIYNENEEIIPNVIKQALQKKYTINFQTINTKNYEVPQSRERVIILGTKKGIRKIWEMPTPSTKIITMEEAIGHIPPIDPFIKDISKEEFQKLYPLYEKKKKRALAISPWNIPPKHVLRNVITMQYTPTGKSAFDNKEFKPRKKNGELVKGFKNTYKRQHWDRPAYTIAMDNIEISSQNNVHPGRHLGKDSLGNDIYSDPRALTLYELMILMSIPYNWPVPPTTNPIYLRKIIGEGIPSLLIKKIFEKII